MATVLIQADANKGGTSNVSTILSGVTQDIKAFNIAGITRSFASGGTPDAEITAAIGSEHTDLTSGQKYINTDGAANWEQINTGLSLADVPPDTGIELQIGAKQYISAHAATSTAGNMVAITYTQTVGQEVAAAALPISTFVIRTAATVATSGSAVIGWYQVGGLAEVSVDGSGTAILVGDFLEVLDATTALIKAGTSRVLTAAAKAVDASTSAEIVTVFLINEQHTVADT
jgi:hypothetical protein